MKYMILIYGSEAAWAALQPSETEEIGTAHRSIQRHLTQTGELVDHKELALDDARILLPVGGVCTPGQGPLRRGDLILGGYYIVDCVTRERALEIAGLFKEAAFAPIEVRRLTGGTTWDEGAPSL